jgi:hypothetical protein
MEEATEAAKLLADLPGSFGKSLTMIMEWRDMSVELLGEKALLDPRMIQRMRNDHKQNWNIKRMVALCIGLRLPPIMSLPLITKAGLSFKNTEEHIVCQHILTTRFNSTIYECNDLLAEAGYPPLSGDE